MTLKDIICNVEYYYVTGNTNKEFKKYKKVIAFLKREQSTWDKTKGIVYKGEFIKRTAKVVSGLMRTNGKFYIFFQHQSAIVSTFDEALTFIESLRNRKVDDLPIYVDDDCYIKLEKIFDGVYMGAQKLMTTNTGNNPILVAPAFGDTTEEHLEVVHQMSEENGWD